MKPQTISVSNVHIILGIVCSAKTVHFAKNVPILFIWISRNKVAKCVPKSALFANGIKDFKESNVLSV